MTPAERAEALIDRATNAGFADANDVGVRVLCDGGGRYALTAGGGTATVVGLDREAALRALTSVVERRQPPAVETSASAAVRGAADWLARHGVEGILASHHTSSGPEVHLPVPDFNALTAGRVVERQAVNGYTHLQCKVDGVMVIAVEPNETTTYDEVVEDLERTPTEEGEERDPTPTPAPDRIEAPDALDADLLARAAGLRTLDCVTRLLDGRRVETWRHARYAETRVSREGVELHEERVPGEDPRQQHDRLVAECRAGRHTKAPAPYRVVDAHSVGE